MYRGFQSGAAVGAAVGFVGSAKLWRNSAPAYTISRTILSSTGIGAVFSTAMMAVILPLHMRGREEIEWKDRSWRLLENKGQVSVDNWGLAGSNAGAAIIIATWKPSKMLGRRPFWGAVGLGNVAAIVGYLVWKTVAGKEAPEPKKALGPLSEKIRQYILALLHTPDFLSLMLCPHLSLTSLSDTCYRRWNDD